MIDTWRVLNVENITIVSCNSLSQHCRARYPVFGEAKPVLGFISLHTHRQQVCLCLIDKIAASIYEIISIMKNNCFKLA